MTSADDVLELYGITRHATKPRAVGADAQALLAHLQDGPLTADELLRVSGLVSAQTAAALIELELAGSISLEDGVYRASV